MVAIRIINPAVVGLKKTQLINHMIHIITDCCSNTIGSISDAHSINVCNKAR